MHKGVDPVDNRYFLIPSILEGSVKAHLLVYTEKNNKSAANHNGRPPTDTPPILSS